MGVVVCDCLIGLLVNVGIAETERKGTDHLDLAGAPTRKSQDRETTQALPTSTETKKKPKGLRKFFGRYYYYYYYYYY